MDCPPLPRCFVGAPGAHFPNRSGRAKVFHMRNCVLCGQVFTGKAEKVYCSWVCKRTAGKRRERAKRAKPRRSLAERLDALSIPEPNSGCRLWLSRLTTRGYGQLRVDRHWRKAHQVAYELAKGPIPPGKMVCHTCDVQICIEGNHLYAGTAKTNSDDMFRRGRAPPRPSRRLADGRFASGAV